MQETKFLDDDDLEQHRKEMFYGSDYANLTAQMNDRLMELEPKGHTLVRRKYYQNVSSMRRAEREKKALKKLHRQVKRKTKEQKLTALEINNLHNNPVDSKYSEEN